MRVFAIILFLLSSPGVGWAERVALVIGNSAYTSVASLDNPKNDSADVARALSKQGFDVIRADNLGRVAMRDTLREFRAMADRSEIALVYYAGHGIEIGGINYLVPVDARLEDERDAGLEMVEVDLVLRQISGARTLKMVVLDACRNNPFVTKMQRQGGTRSVSQGLADIRWTEADTLISYAAAAGEITPDGQTGENSPFTAAFLKALAGPPADVRRMLGRVRDQMRLSVPGSAPFVYSSLGGGEYVINPRSAGGVPTVSDTAVSSAVAPNTAATGGNSISLDFVKIDRNGSVADWDDFLIRHEAQSTHPLYAFALEKRAALQGETVSSRSSNGTISSVSTSPVATNSVKRSTGSATQDTSPSLVLLPTLTTKQVAQSLQTELKKQACYFGRIDGIFGRKSKRGLTEFAHQAGVPITLPSSPDASQLRAALDIVGAFPDVRCPRVARRSTPAKPSKRTTKAAAAPAAPTQAETGQKKKKLKPVIFSTLPCPKAEELKLDRPECH
jgi:hypothetical protein